jgi:hypothetical protein
MKLKLYNVDIYASCGAVTLGTILGKCPYKIEEEIIAYRKKNPPNLDDYIVRSNWLEDRSITFFEEALHFAKPFIGRNKVITPARQIDLFRLVNNVLDPNHVYMVMTKDHLQLVWNYSVWDTVSRGGHISQHVWRNNGVISYIKLNKTGIITK